MKYILYFLLLFTNLGLAQSTFFSKSIDFGNREQGLHIDTCSNGLILSSYTYSGYLDIVKTDFQGNVLWRNVKYGSIICDMKVINDTIYFTGNNFKEKKNKNSIQFHALTINGDSLYTRSYGSGEDKYEKDLYFCTTDDGGYIFAYDSDYDSYLNQIIVFKTDKAGKVQWKQNITKSKGFNSIELYGLDKLKNDEYLVRTTVEIENDPKPTVSFWGTSPKIFYTKINAKGNVLLSKIIVTDTLKEVNMTAVQKRKGTDFFVQTFMIQDSLVLKAKTPSQMVVMDSAFNYTKKGTKFFEKYATLFYKHYELENGDFLGCGYNENNDTSTNIHIGGATLARFDPNGILKWQRNIIDWRYSDSGYIRGLSDLEVLKNKDIVLVGGFYGFKDKDHNIWLIRLDSMGCPKPNCKGRLQNITYASTEIEDKQGVFSDIKVFPNPTEGIIWIELLEQNLDDKLKVEVLDSYGRVQQYKQLNVDETIFKLDISDLSAGLYFLRVQDKNGKIGVKKIMKQ